MGDLKSFISYRRDDTIVVGNVDRIYEQLSGYFGGENVFMDIDTIPPGQDFRQVLDEAVAKADVLLAVMGREWTKFIKKRARDPKDFVRIEIESALQRKIPVIPVLIGDTRMPGEKHLPVSIKKLAWCNAVRIDPRRHFQADVERLIADLEKHYGGRGDVRVAANPMPEPEPAKPAPLVPPRTDSAKSPALPKKPAPRRKPAKPGKPSVPLLLGGAATLAAVALFIAKPWRTDHRHEGENESVEESVRISPGRPPSTKSPGSSEPAQADEAPPSPLETETPFTNSLGMKFVPVPGLDGVLFSVWETRVQDYAAYASAPGNSGVDDEWKNYEYRGHKQEPNHPVVNVSWEDAVAFCKWLSEKEGRTYRLPADHEWSVAVGIGDREDPSTSPSAKESGGSVYPWGSQWPPPKDSGNFFGIESASPLNMDDYTDDYPFTAPVGSFSLEHHGIKDLSGNVYEWCQDWFDSDHDARVLRGGSWYPDHEFFLKSSARNFRTPTDRYNRIGFRCVLEFGGGG